MGGLKGFVVVFARRADEEPSGTPFHKWFLGPFALFAFAGGAPRHDYSCNLHIFQDLELTDFYSCKFLSIPDLCGTLPFWNSHHPYMLYVAVERWMNTY